MKDYDLFTDICMNNWFHRIGHGCEMSGKLSLCSDSVSVPVSLWILMGCVGVYVYRYRKKSEV